LQAQAPPQAISLARTENPASAGFFLLLQRQPMTWSASAADLRRSAVPSLRKKPKVFLLRSALVFYAAEADQVIGRLVCASFRKIHV